MTQIPDDPDKGACAFGQLLGGGKALSATCYAPTVLLEPPENCRVSTRKCSGRWCASMAMTIRKKPSSGPTHCLGPSSCRLHPQLCYRDARLRAARRFGGHAERPHGVSRRVDAFRRAAPIGSRRRRHPLHLPRHADRKAFLIIRLTHVALDQQSRGFRWCYRWSQSRLYTRPMPCSAASRGATRSVSG